MVEDDSNPFWRFSISLYGREGVAAACLGLQDRLELDVNLLLFCCWTGSRGRAQGELEIAALIAETRDLREQVVQPLRAARRWLKGQVPALGPAAGRLRADIKASELAAEKIQQDLMFQAHAVPEGAPSAVAVAGNLRAYLTALGRAPSVTDISDLAAVLRGACPELAPLDAIRLLDRDDG